MTNTNHSHCNFSIIFLCNYHGTQNYITISTANFFFSQWSHVKNP